MTRQWMNQPAHEKDDVLAFPLPSPMSVFRTLPIEQDGQTSVLSFAALASDEPPQHVVDRVCSDLHSDPERFARDFLRMRKAVERLNEQVQGLLAREVIR
jgi:hypothetical protein